MSGPKGLFETGMAILKDSGASLGDTAELAMTGMALLNEVTEFQRVTELVTAITTEALMAFILQKIVNYFGPKMFYPYLLLAPFTAESKNLFLTTTPAIMVHRFDATKYDLKTSPPYTYVNIELHHPTVLVQQFEFRSPSFDSTLTGKIQIDIRDIAVNVTVKLSTSKCMVKLIKMNISRIEGFKPNVFVDSDNSQIHPVCERFMEFMDEEFEQMFVSRLYKAVYLRLQRFAYGRSLLSCSKSLVKTWL